MERLLENMVIAKINNTSLFEDEVNEVISFGYIEYETQIDVSITYLNMDNVRCVKTGNIDIESGFLSLA